MDQKYRIQNVENIPSPALVVYLDLVSTEYCARYRYCRW